MNRRSFVRSTAVAGIGLASVSVPTTAREILSKETSTASAPPPAFELDELTIAELQSGVASGRFTPIRWPRSISNALRTLTGTVRQSTQ